jgi:hypothetical protein
MVKGLKIQTLGSNFLIQGWVIDSNFLQYIIKILFNFLEKTLIIDHFPQKTKGHIARFGVHPFSTVVGDGDSILIYFNMF